MAKFKITYLADHKEDEEVEASRFADEGNWITFYKRAPGRGQASRQVLRVIGDHVERIERVDD